MRVQGSLLVKNGTKIPEGWVVNEKTDEGILVVADGATEDSIKQLEPTIINGTVEKELKESDLTDIDKGELEEFPED